MSSTGSNGSDGTAAAGAGAGNSSVPKAAATQILLMNSLDAGRKDDVLRILATTSIGDLFNIKGTSVLHKAVQTGDSEIVQAIVNAIIPGFGLIDAVDSSGKTALALAAEAATATAAGIEDASIVKILILANADTNLPYMDGLSIADAASEGIFAPLTSDYIISGYETDRVIENIEAHRPLKYIFSQRGDTCATDLAYTIIFEADPIRTYMLAGDYLNVHGAYDVSRALRAAKSRYQRMQLLSKTARPTLRTRERSENANNNGEKLGIEMKTCTSSLLSGTSFNDIYRTFTSVLKRDRFKLLPANLRIDVHTQDDAPQPFENVFAMIFYIECKEKEEELSHAVGMLKQGGEWFFADNEIGLLHPIANKIFVEQLFNTTIADANAVSFNIPADEDLLNILKSMYIEYIIYAGRRAYPFHFPEFVSDRYTVKDMLYLTATVTNSSATNIINSGQRITVKTRKGKSGRSGKRGHKSRRKTHRR